MVENGEPIFLEITPEDKYKLDDALNNKPEVPKNVKAHVRMFFSYDIVNSTMYKDLNREGWAQDLKIILLNLIAKCEETTFNADFWKTIGDEIVFTKKISDKLQLFDTVENIYDILTTMNRELQDGKYIKTTNQVDKIALKATAWIADISESEHETSNIITEYEARDDVKQVDFIGPDIDAGFRIAQFSAKNRLVLSFELASLLIENSNNEANRLSKTALLGSHDIVRSVSSKLFVISFRKLKGIWNNRMYPIIWYHKGPDSLEESFEYDQIAEYDILKEYKKNILGENNNFPYKDFFTDTEKLIARIRQNMPLVNKRIANLNSLIKKFDGESGFSFQQLESHYATVCYRDDTGEPEILIFYRDYNGKKRWEFGCAKINKKEPLIETVTSFYKKTFGIEIDIHKDKNRVDCQPIPIALYEVENSKKGIIIFAKIRDSFDVVLTEKYKDHKYISKDEIYQYKDNAVSDFCDTLLKVFEQVKKLKEDELMVSSVSEEI